MEGKRLDYYAALINAYQVYIFTSQAQASSTATEQRGEKKATF